jgi:parallel beta-helix repeat protein
MALTKVDYAMLKDGAISVKAYGAIGNGVANDTVALQAALDSGEKCLFIPAGTYNFTQLLIRGNDIELYGEGNATVLNCTSTTTFCAIALVENYRYIYLHDFKLQGAITSEPAGPSPLRGIVNGTNTAGTAHSAVVYDAYARLQRIHITGQTPATNGFNIGVQFNTSNYSTMQDCVVESLYGSNPNYGHGIVCNGTGQQVLNNRFLSTISGQGRHAIYLTNLPVSSKVVGNYCEGFQSEAITSNTVAGYDLLIDGNTCVDCMQTETGTTAAVIAIISSPYSKIINNTIQNSNVHGISVSGSNQSIIANNTMSTLVEIGIFITGNDNSRIVNNIIIDPDSAATNTYGGIEIISCNYLYVSGNKISGNYRYGIRYNNTAPVPTYTQVFDNDITGTYTFEIENPAISLTNSVRQILSQPKQLQYTAGATTIDVSQNVRTVFGIQNGGATTITALNNAYNGQIVTLVFFDTVTQVQRNALISLAGGVNFVATNKSSLTLAYYNSTVGWYEIGRTTNVA